MKEPLHGRKYDDLSGLASAVNQWVRKTPLEFYTEGIGKLPGRWQKCVKLKEGNIKGSNFQVDIDSNDYSFYDYHIL